VTSPDVQIVVLPDTEAAAHEVARRLSEVSGQVVLTGGSTPRRAYELAAEMRAEWDAVEFWFGDERCVPPDDERSNYGMVKAALLDRLRGAPRAVHRIRGELGKDAAAAAYERELGETAFDLLLLGIGPDGHVASLFPHAPTLREESHRVVPAEPGFEPFVDRVTLTLPAIASAETVLFLVTGEEKAPACERAFGGEPSSATPASLARGRRTGAVLDRGAASLLPP
jgi:6-phosphogluconolactonase